MKEPSKHVLNGIIIVLVAIIIAITFTINYSSVNKASADCYKKSYAGRLIYLKKHNYMNETKEEMEGAAASYAGFRCLKK